MDHSKFGTKKAGELVPISGLVGATHAFVPDDLPPKWEWDNDLYKLLIDARTAIASLDGIGRHLPNPDLLLRPLQNREAKSSSSLEGTITKPEQQILFDINPKYPESENDPTNDYREVFNYGRALRCRFEKRVDLPLSLRLIKELHGILMEGVRGQNQDPGNFRKTQVQIGAPARFIPPPFHHVPQCLDSFERYIYSEKKYDPLIEAFIAHYQFEAIHPFRDGNGRVGRLLLSIMIAEWLDLSAPWLYLSPYFDRNKDDYIDRLFNISTVGDWRGWIEFCLDAAVVQAKDTEKRCEKLITLSRDFKEKIQSIGGNVRMDAIVDDLFIAPVLRIPYVAKKYNITYPTAKTAIEKLMTIGIIVEVEDQPTRTFLSPQIFEVTFGE
jgi:Fic family protein